MTPGPIRPDQGSRHRLPVSFATRALIRPAPASEHRRAASDAIPARTRLAQDHHPQDIALCVTPGPIRAVRVVKSHLFVLFATRALIKPDPVLLCQVHVSSVIPARTRPVRAAALLQAAFCVLLAHIRPDQDPDHAHFVIPGLTRQVPECPTQVLAGAVILGRIKRVLGSQSPVPALRVMLENIRRGRASRTQPAAFFAMQVRIRQVLAWVAVSDVCCATRESIRQVLEQSFRPNAFHATLGHIKLGQG